MLILLIILLLLFAGGGWYAPTYRTSGFSLAGIVLVVLLVWFLLGGSFGRVL